MKLHYMQVKLCWRISEVTTLLSVKCSLNECCFANSVKRTVQYRFHRSAAFAPQSAAVPAERAVLEAVLPKLRKVFVPKTNKLIIAEMNEAKIWHKNY